MSTDISQNRLSPDKRRRSTRKLLTSKAWILMLPSLLSLLIIGVIALLLIVIPDEVNRRSSYEMETYRAMSTGDFLRAKNCLDSLINLSGDNPRPEYLYQLAVLSEQTGDNERAFRLLQRLTLPDQAGYAPAHVNLAKYLLSIPNPQPAQLDEAERHIRSLLAQQNNSPEYLDMLARLELSRKRPEDALKTYELMVRSDPTVGLPMGQILKTLKRDDEAKTYLNQAITKLQSNLDQDFENIETRLRLADAYMLLDQYQDSVRVIQNGITLGDNTNRLRQALCIVLGRWANSLDSKKIEDQHKRLNLLVQGLSIDPTQPQLLDQFWKLTIDDLGGDPNTLLKLRVMGTNLSILDAITGLQKLKAGKKDEAKEAFAACVKKSPDMFVLLNNLTTIGELRDSAKNSTFGTDLLSVLLEIDPTKNNILENRGLIYMKQQKFAEAVKDLEKVVDTTPNKQNVHLALSTAFDKLGDKQKADIHRNISETLLRSSKPNVANRKDEEEKSEDPAKGESEKKDS